MYVAVFHNPTGYFSVQLQLLAAPQNVTY